MDELCFNFADSCFDFLLLHSVRARAGNVLTFCICFDIPQATVAKAMTPVKSQIELKSMVSSVHRAFHMAVSDKVAD